MVSAVAITGVVVASLGVTLSLLGIAYRLGGLKTQITQEHRNLRNELNRMEADMKDAHEFMHNDMYELKNEVDGHGGAHIENCPICGKDD